MRKGKTVILLLGTILFSVAIVFGLYLGTKKTDHRNKAINRNYHNFAGEKNSINLEVNSYYFAGKDAKNIYLGNLTAPLKGLQISMDLQDTVGFQVVLSKEDLPFSNIKLAVNNADFYVSDGTVPVIFHGKTTDWKATIKNQNIAYFSKFVPVDSSHFIVRVTTSRSRQNEMALLNFTGSSTISINPKILEKQIDGIFDTDGTMAFNHHLNRMVYTYYYRNKFIVFKPDLKVEFVGSTIDTITMAQLEVDTLSNSGTVKMSAPSYKVNLGIATYNNHLYVNSERLGRNEANNVLRKATIIDTYDLLDGSYLFSFLVPTNNQKLRNFIVVKNQLYALMGNHIVRYTLEFQDQDH